MEGSFRSKVYLTLNLDQHERFDVGGPGRMTLHVDRLQILTDIRDGLPRTVHVWGNWDMPEREAEGRSPARGDMVVSPDRLPDTVVDHFGEAFKNWARTVFQAWAQSARPAS